MDFTKGQDELVLLGPEGFGFNSFDTNCNGVLDNAYVGVTVAQGNTVLDFSAYGAPSTLTRAPPGHHEEGRLPPPPVGAGEALARSKRQAVPSCPALAHSPPPMLGQCCMATRMPAP